jgi:hypothetical protein
MDLAASQILYKKKSKKVKLSPQQAVEAYSCTRC